MISNLINMKRFSILLAAALIAVTVQAQNFPGQRRSPNDTLQSVKVNPDKSVTFQIYAPEAKNVQLSGDLAGWGDNRAKFTKNSEGVWTTTQKNDKVSIYRYGFIVDGVAVNDPKAKVSRDMPPYVAVDPDGTAFWAMKDVPHGAVSQIYYKSKTFDRTKSMHIYTPPGYNQIDKLPVLYLIHGGGENDFVWSNVGRANFIMDNLLAEKKCVPMIVVMPDGGVGMGVEKFTDEMMNDIIPYVEDNYKVFKDNEHRAVAGLSMGGLETLDISLKNYKSFAYVFPMSTGWFSDSPAYAQWEPYLKEHAQEMNKYFKVYKFFMGGEEDIAYKNGKKTLETFDKCGVKYEYSEMHGGHSWYVWRDNLHDLAQLLFK